MQGTEQTNTGLSSQLDAGVNATGTRVGYWIVQNGNENYPMSSGFWSCWGSKPTPDQIFVYQFVLK